MGVQIPPALPYMTFTPRLFWPYCDLMDLKDELLQLVHHLAIKRTGENIQKFGESSIGYTNHRLSILNTLVERLQAIYGSKILEETKAIIDSANNYES